MRLKVNGAEVAVCSYTKGEISRRAHWLIESPTHVLVQYLSEQSLFSLDFSLDHDHFINNSSSQGQKVPIETSTVGSDDMILP